VTRPDDEPYFEIRCEGCGTTFHAGDGDGTCPNCDCSTVSYDAQAAREWTEWTRSDRSTPW
jgi:uncharacterized Zn finger protein (UPF0148 family)